MGDTVPVDLTSLEDNDGSQLDRQSPDVAVADQAMDVDQTTIMEQANGLADSPEGPTVGRSSSSHAISEAEEEPEEATEVTRARLASKSMQTTLDTSGASWSLNRARTTSTGTSAKKDLKKTSSRGGNNLSQMALRLRKFAAGAEKRPEDEEADMVLDGADLDEQEEAMEEATTETEKFVEHEHEHDVETEREGEAGSVEADIIDLEEPSSSTSLSRPDHSATDSSFATAIEEPVTAVEYATLEIDSHRTFRDKVVDLAGGREVTMSFDLDAIKSRWHRPPANTAELDRATSVPLSRHDELEGAAVTGDAHVAEETLTRMVSQDDFAEMEVLGQFNLGFIVARRRGCGVAKGKATGDVIHDDLFIIDQHASDEVSALSLFSSDRA
jgi:DNA mismatch repair ATPase MutL